MIEPRLTREELEARQQPGAKLASTQLETTCASRTPPPTPEEAAFALWERYPDTYSYEAFLKSTRTVQEITDLLTTRQ